MYTMKESVAVAKEADAKKVFSPTKSDSSIQRVRDEHERQLGSLRGVIGNITRNGDTPSVESIATELSSVPSAQRAPVLLALQQTHGNRYVQRVVAGIQAKLVVGQPGDKYEQEADRVADVVMRMPEPRVQRQFEPEEEEKELLQGKPLAEEITPRVQRQVEPEEGEEELIQTKAISEQITPLVQRQEGEEEEAEIQTKPLPRQTSEVVSDVEISINSIRGGGQLLSDSTRAFFEPRFGCDFSQVRVHADARAADTARAVNARAFTRGHDVVFGAGQYAPGTTAGQRLLAHELTHVVQQKTSRYTLDAPELPFALHHSDTVAPTLQRLISPTICSPDKMLSVNVDGYRARGMLLVASAKLKAYAASFGLWPSSVSTSMNRHFGTTLSPFAGILGDAAVAMALQTQANITTTLYACRSTGSWPCSSNTLAWVPWCLPGPIMLCDPSYFNQTGRERSTTLIHEWTHKFWCRLDIGYEHETGYPRNLFTASLNADNFANIVRDLQ
jgi:hypothetical protein